MRKIQTTYVLLAVLILIVPSKLLSKSMSAESTVLELDLHAFKKNIAILRKALKNNSLKNQKPPKLCAVFKSNAYGLGVARFAQVAVNSGIDAFCIESNVEASAIRQAIERPDFPIIRIAPATARQVDTALREKLNIQEMVGSLWHAKMLSHAWEKLDDPTAPPIEFHLNLDTGMSRMGFKSVQEAQKVLAIKHLRLAGVMSHLANAYRTQPTALKLSLKQNQHFEQSIQKLNIPHTVTYHLANSGGALLSPELHQDMVRAGSSLFGYPFTASERKPKISFKSVVKKLKTKVVFIQHNLPPNTPIGYNSAFKTPSNAKSSIATIPIGFAHGIPHNAKGLEVLIRGERYPVVGEIGMNLSMVNITPKSGHTSLVEVGDEVVIIGKQGNQEISLVNLANKLGFSPIALLLQLGQQNVKSI